MARSTAMSHQPSRFQLFLDESGDFLETSTDSEERGRTKNAHFPSQLAGLLVPQGQLTSESASRLLAQVCQAAGTTYAGEFHATEHPKDMVEVMVRHLLPIVVDRRWQPVRLVNLEKVEFGDRVATYTNLVAELTLRCFQNLRLAGMHSVEIELHCAGVWDDVAQATFQEADYLSRLTEVMARASIRAGVADLQRSWHISGFRFRSGQRHAEMHLCDLLSNSSKANFDRLTAETRTAFKDALGRFDLSLLVREDLQRIDQIAADGSTAMALITLAERLFDRDVSDRHRTNLNRRLGALVDDLASLGAPARDPQLQVIGNFLEQTINWERDLQKGRSHCNWFLDNVAKPLRDRLPTGERDEVAWFLFQLHLRSLSAANHHGDLAGARASSLELQMVQGALVQRWERLDLFLQAQINIAVHLTDSRELQPAIATAMSVASYHESLSDLFHAAMPEALPKLIRSERCGQALGTAMQATMLAGLEDVACFAEARELGNRALEQFDNASDRNRQYQYRCQLETFAKKFEAARGWLAKALGIQESSHQALSQAIVLRAEGSPERGFLLLHWLRLGAIASIDDPMGPEASSFRSAWGAEGMVSDPWCTGITKDHPAPSILRYLGEVQILGNEESAAIGILRKLRDLTLPIRKDQVLLSLPLLGLQATAYLQLAPNNHARAKPLLDNGDKAVPGVVQLVDLFTPHLKEFSAWTHVLGEWRSACTTLRGSGHSKEAMARLQQLARSIAF